MRLSVCSLLFGGAAVAISISVVKKVSLFDINLVKWGGVWFDRRRVGVKVTPL